MEETAANAHTTQVASVSLPYLPASSLALSFCTYGRPYGMIQFRAGSARRSGFQAKKARTKRRFGRGGGDAMAD